MPVDAYFKETSRLLNSPLLTEQLRGVLEAVEEFEALGIALEDAWRSDEDWQRLARIKLLLLTITPDIDVHFNSENADQWRTRHRMRQSIHLVKEQAIAKPKKRRGKAP